MTTVLHLTPLEEYDAAGERLHPASLDTEGFVHCTGDGDTLLAVANHLYREADGQFVALEVDTARNTASTVFEEAAPAPPPGVDASVRFPHIYGPIDLSAVVGLRYARRTLDGRFVDFESRPSRAEELDLLPHPEGGWYRRTWTSPTRLAVDGGSRAAATAIHYLLTDGRTSRWHRVGSDELWLWHGPGTLDLELDSSVSRLDGVRTAQVLVPGGTWQRARAHGDVLVSCVVCPGFDFADFEMLDT
ncbi:cupin domain-containing protein [Haloechinothrix sp. YIM 98757]|uniref:Cupin domain-containing protein n=1 Tax=Haloechinothrix aidingensis TaxID=2752311 RepID=A0A838ABF9_9PSEU|nr:cupin domain-containing protein [Haloechinothrix aidingensis]MBA0126538.1 cupin domain-containing protein [Haloechinothrix aidingensis]